MPVAIDDPPLVSARFPSASGGIKVLRVTPLD
jgi:hypothetical protein